MFRQLTFHTLVLLILFSCQNRQQTREPMLPASGNWRGIIHTQGQTLPFNFRIEHGSTGGIELVLINGEEELPVQDIRISQDSIFIPMHIFDAQLLARFSNGEMKGYWIKNYAEDYAIPFSAQHGATFRFVDQPQPSEVNLTGRWEVYFENDSGKRLAVGEFNQEGNNIRGTFLRPSGDYRYLVGEMDRNALYLSTFDGEHAYLFTGLVSNDSISGDFYSGKSRHEKWTAIRNESITLQDAHTLSYLKEGYTTLDFELPDLNGNPVTLNDPKYENKIVIVQVFGTWCSNCMDETRFLSDWYNENKDRGVEIIALAFERKDDLDYARTRIEKLKTRFNIQYDFLFGGQNDKSYRTKALPMLEGAVSFPTMIIMDRAKNIRDIHTGFSGPGTGEHYTDFVSEFNTFMDNLIEEQPETQS